MIFPLGFFAKRLGMIETIKVVMVIHIEYKVNGKTHKRLARCAHGIDPKAAYLKAWNKYKMVHKKLELIYLEFKTVTKSQFLTLKTNLNNERNHH